MEYTALLLLIIILVLVLNQNRSKKKSNKLLRRQKNEITTKNKILEELLEDKEWLVKEIHHRVKNNLHTIVSLLESQSAYLGSDALAAVRDSQHRVFAMSLIHQKLYMADNVTTVDMALYIQDLANYLSESFESNQRVRIYVDAEPIKLDAASAIPLGLILNEAITNSIKYAFPDRTGMITITLKEEGPLFLLTIADDGIGLPDGFNFSDAHSLGSRLMKGLSQEIDADLVVRNYQGVSISISFKHTLFQRRQYAPSNPSP